MADVELILLQEDVRERAAKERNVPLDHVFIEYSDPKTHGGEYWNVMIGLNSGPGTDTLDADWTYSNKTYEEGVQRLAARKLIWSKPWQEDIREEFLELPWDIDEPWFLESTPYGAWEMCNNPEALAFILSFRKHRQARSLAQAAYRMLKVCTGPYGEPFGYCDTRPIFHAIEREDIRAIERNLVQMEAIVPETDLNVPPTKLLGWHADQAFMDAARVIGGDHRRLFYEAYHLKQLLSPHDHHLLAKAIKMSFTQRSF